MQYAIFHKFRDGDFVCYGPDGAFYDTLEEAEKALPHFAGSGSEGVACIVPVNTTTAERARSDDRR